MELPLHLVCCTDHGAQAVAHTHSSAAAALSLLRDNVSRVCDVWMRASAVGSPALRADDEIERVVECFGGDGQSRP